jgi:hypothetical protein
MMTPIEGIFYDKQDEDYEVEKILKTRIKNEKKELLILSRSFPESMASCIPAENLKN